MRSKGSSNPKEAGQQAVANYTAEAGPEGPKLRRKYLFHQIKSTRPKTSGNSGKTGKKYRSYVRGHQGGQVPSEEKARREAQSREAIANRDTVAASR
jgi:hypothetical protein